jgi:chromosome partitioning protein
MTLVITIAQRKGGAGKSTLACQLAATFAARGLAVAGIDLDEQQSFAHWSRMRAGRTGVTPVDVFASASFALSSKLERAADGADLVIIDTPPSINNVVSRAARQADFILAPLQLSPLDLEASLPTAKLIGASRTPALFVINRAPPRARIADQIRQLIREHHLPVAASELGNRAAFAESLARGMGVVETEPSGIAAREITALADEVLGRARLARAA